MSLILWTDELAVDIKVVDDQHKKLIALLNGLFDAMKRGKGKVVLGFVLKELIDYTAYHFSTEEALFEKYDYPEAHLHKLEHDIFKKEVLDFKIAFDNEESLVTVEVLDFLTKWLQNHIMKEDKRFGPFLKTRDVA